MFAKDIQQQKFQDRLNRVAAGGANTTSQIYAGTVEPARKAKKYETRSEFQSVVPSSPTVPGVLVSLVGGLLIGVIAVVLARYLRFRLTGSVLGGSDADLIMVADIVFSITIVIILRTVFRLRSKLHGFAKLAGVVATILLMHNAVHIAPGIFERVYSVEWVNQVVQTTKSNSVLVAGVSYEFFDPSSRDIPEFAVLR